MLRKIINKIKEVRFAKSQSFKLHQKGSLLNAFYLTKVIFIHIPKTAGTSLVEAIYGDVSKEGHRKISFYQQIIGADMSSYFSFCFVRNPYDRLYSSYKFLEKGGMNIHDQKAFAKHLSKYNDFEDFVLNGLNEKIINSLTHFIPQTDFICNKKDDILVDFVGKFESIDSDTIILSDKIGVEIKLNHLNKNTKNFYLEIYTKEMLSIVHNIYNRDFIILGY